ncbi:hypothetical protein WYY_00889 [Bacillus velezensis M27]|uniref:Uncharacterized protein n=2 Tax=Bacillus amyloliquefaciens group TaxID=1938374 RepID=I2CC69_BACAY|nr:MULTISPECIES: hypothetical protein [Bacillus]SLA97231.1 Uncharacterised protein [Mycobacteroides abscessus subsp. massiliense]AFJ64243.1 hypothetical protein MUS_4411 [Bacillus velezensis YAU B9601-Y2]AIU83897.1 hypothetical protein NG74_03896 [Bacillus velezensis]ASS62707.1 hypothetical protein CHN56_02246 [Bacillus velezensis]ATC51321.1 hypothetical protein CLI97_02014 [Bacillus velezensis]
MKTCKFIVLSAALASLISIGLFAQTGSTAQADQIIKPAENGAFG